MYGNPKNYVVHFHGVGGGGTGSLPCSHLMEAMIYVEWALKKDVEGEPTNSFNVVKPIINHPFGNSLY